MREPKTKRRAWSKQEVVRLKEMWPNWPMRDILKAFPNRSWRALIQKASELRLKRTRIRLLATANTKARKRPAGDYLLAQLREHRADRGLTARFLAKEMGYAHDMVTNWERGRSKPRYAALLDWCQALNVVLKAHPAPTTGQPSQGLPLKHDKSGAARG